MYLRSVICDNGCMLKSSIIEKARKLRVQGKSYLEISEILGENIPKSTMAYWFKDLILPKQIQTKLKNENLIRLLMGRAISRRNHVVRRSKYFEEIKKENAHLSHLLADKDVAKIALSMLFLAEGSKRGGLIVFGNSSPYIISLFLHLLRTCYKLDEEKFRCTVQCRADQNIYQLEAFWSNITGIPRNKFSKAQIDKRTIGKPTKKVEYKGVCRITHFSAHIFNDMSSVPKIIYRGP